MYNVHLCVQNEWLIWIEATEKIKWTEWMIVQEKCISFQKLAACAQRVILCNGRTSAANKRHRQISNTITFIIHIIWQTSFVVRCSPKSAHICLEFNKFTLSSLKHHLQFIVSFSTCFLKWFFFFSPSKLKWKWVMETHSSFSHRQPTYYSTFEMT